MRPKLYLITLVIVILLVSLGCTVTSVNLDTVKVGELVKESEVVELNDANDVRVYVKMGAGELQIGGGAEELLKADFTYNVTAWKPQVEYSINDSSGRLTIRQPKTDQISFHHDTRYEWDLKLNDKVPLDLRIESGAGNVEIELGTLNVTQADIKLGAGDVEVDLSDNESLTNMDLDMGAGDVFLNLNGDWEHDVEVNIQGGVGRIRVSLPESIGVRVKVDKGLGDVDASGLYRRDNTYVNSAYDEADVILEVNIQAGIGQVDLEVVD